MAEWWCQMVPKDRPNATGEWMKFDLGVVEPSFDMELKPGYSVCYFLKAISQPRYMGSPYSDDITFSVYPDLIIRRD